MKNILLILITILLSINNMLAQNNSPCTATLLCSDAPVTSIPTGASSVSIKGTCTTLSAKKVAYYRVKIQKAGIFTFEIKPSVAGTDYDWAAWRLPAGSGWTCSTVASNSANSTVFETGDNKRISFDAGGNGITGLRTGYTQTCAPGTSGNPFLKPFTVYAGDEIIIAIDLHPAGSNVKFTLTFGGDAILSCNEDIKYTDISVCDENGDGQETYSLSNIKNMLVNDTSEPNITAANVITYYTTLAAAKAGTGAITSVTVTNSPKKIYCRIMTGSNLYAIFYVTLSLKPTPKPVITGGSSICPGETTILMASSGFDSYNWNTGAKTQSITVGTTGTYTVTVTKNGCSGSASIKVNANSSLTTPTASGVSICAGETATLTASGSGTIEWYDLATGGTLLHTGATYTTPTLTSGATYYVQAVSGSCKSSRVPVIVTVLPKVAKPIIKYD